jgi:hypothetical protein
VGTGPYETIGDLLRADGITMQAAAEMVGGINYDYAKSLNYLVEGGLNSSPYGGGGLDEDGDGITDERDERDMIFTWISNYYTTRSSVFEVDMNVQLCDPPYYPGGRYPFKTYRIKREYARKQLLGILDRSTALRVAPDGTCDFSGPIGTRMLRTTDDLIVY